MALNTNVLTVCIWIRWSSSISYRKQLHFFFFFWLQKQLHLISQKMENNYIYISSNWSFKQARRQLSAGTTWEMFYVLVMVKFIRTGQKYENIYIQKQLAAVVYMLICTICTYAEVGYIQCTTTGPSRTIPFQYSKEIIWPGKCMNERTYILKVKNKQGGEGILDI